MHFPITTCHVSKHNKFRALAYPKDLPLAPLIYTKKFLTNTKENFGYSILIFSSDGSSRSAEFHAYMRVHTLIKRVKKGQEGPKWAKKGQERSRRVKKGQ